MIAIRQEEHLDEATGLVMGLKYTVVVTTDSERQQADILLEALAVYAERNARYNDNWKRQGWRGSLFKLRLKVERIWDVWWAMPLVHERGGLGTTRPDADVDDVLDVINNAVFAVRCIRDGNRDGEWEYPESDTNG